MKVIDDRKIYFDMPIEQVEHEDVFLYKNMLYAVLSTNEIICLNTLRPATFEGTERVVLVDTEIHIV